MLFSLKAHLTFQLSGFHCNSFDYSCYFSCITKNSPSLLVYQRRNKIITDLDSLPPHESTPSTEVSELHIALRKRTRSYTQYPIDKVLYFSYLSPTYIGLQPI